MTEIEKRFIESLDAQERKLFEKAAARAEVGYMKMLLHAEKTFRRLRAIKENQGHESLIRTLDAELSVIPDFIAGPSRRSKLGKILMCQVRVDYLLNPNN